MRVKVSATNGDGTGHLLGTLTQITVLGEEGRVAQGIVGERARRCYAMRYGVIGSDRTGE